MRARVFFLVAVSLLLATAACGPRGTATPEPGVLDTAVAQTVQARLTSEGIAPTAPPQATDTPVPEPTTAPEATHTLVGTTAPTTDTPTPVITIAPPTPTGVPPTPTPIPPGTPPPTPATPTCPLPVAPQFSSQLEAHPEVLLRLGCPQEPARETGAAEQRFQLGGMLWLQDTDEIHIAYGNGAYEVVPDHWEEGDPEQACPEQGPPPTGLVMPKRGFGWHWCNTPGIRTRLGWALEEETGYEAVWQTFERGHVLSNRDGVLLVFYDDGSWNSIG